LILLDTSGLYAVLNDLEPDHEAAGRALESESPPYVLSPFVLCELDYLLATRVGVPVELEFLRQVGSRAYDLVLLDPADVEASTLLVERYQDLNIGLADASIVFLAGRCGTNRVLTLDERHFRAMRTPAGESFVVLPADA
jgi:predicted nucleic acid-binding protein